MQPACSPQTHRHRHIWDGFSVNSSGVHRSGRMMTMESMFIGKWNLSCLLFWRSRGESHSVCESVWLWRSENRHLMCCSRVRSTEMSEIMSCDWKGLEACERRVSLCYLKTKLPAEPLVSFRTRGGTGDKIFLLLWREAGVDQTSVWCLTCKLLYSLTD